MHRTIVSNPVIASVVIMVNHYVLHKTEYFSIKWALEAYVLFLCPTEDDAAKLVNYKCHNFTVIFNITSKVKLVFHAMIIFEKERDKETMLTIYNAIVVAIFLVSL